MGRKRVLSPEQEAQIVQAHAEGLGIKRLVRKFGLGFSLIVRTLRRAPRPTRRSRDPRRGKPCRLPGFWPCRTAPACGAKHVKLVFGICESCYKLGQEWGKRPICRGRCYRCSWDTLLVEGVVDGMGGQGLCGLCWQAQRAAIWAETEREWNRQQAVRKPDSRGLVPTENGLGWRAG